jgi:nucleotide-binding universal stress UspA family protein
MGVIVVGVDHSDGAKAALRFALEEARLRQATLRVVHAWQFGYIGATGLEGAAALPAMGGELEDFRQAAAAALDETLREVGAETDGVTIEVASTRVRPPPFSSTNPAAPTCSSSARAGTEASPSYCSVRSASSARSTRSARS